MAKIKKWTMICPDCGYIGKGKMQGSLLMEIFLFLLFILPWILYYIWRSTQKKSVCPMCGCKSMIPANSPRGQKLIKEYSDEEEEGKAEREITIPKTDFVQSPQPGQSIDKPMPKPIEYLGHTLGWIFGIAFGVFALVSLPTSPVLSLAFIASALLILPPLRKYPSFINAPQRISLALAIVAFSLIAVLYIGIGI